MTVVKNVRKMNVTNMKLASELDTLVTDLYVTLSLILLGLLGKEIRVYFQPALKEETGICKLVKWYWARSRDKASHGPIPIPLGYRGHRALLEEWDRIPQLVINSLIDSMPQRCSTLLDVRGNHTPY
ncbi:hypothetical protein TNCV_4406761 [Trichonephila clavipes]|nr:hypothetical protein TNCV_4406761 [Trichonephila clavipes]